MATGKRKNGKNEINYQDAFFGALDKLADEDIVDLDEEKKAAMVSNLLVVLCADEPAQPVINSGTLNH